MCASITPTPIQTGSTGISYTHIFTLGVPGPSHESTWRFPRKTGSWLTSRSNGNTYNAHDEKLHAAWLAPLSSD